ncbi:MAG: COG1361 S-layer family protein [Candidatus Marsarchaeota archaeon]|nr:COG1361 S-layer family protein [Candidatus Marsarchaeota archaeon]
MLYMSIASAQVSGQSGSIASTPLSLTNLYVSPNPVVAGDTVNITFQLFNSYSQPLQDVNIQLVSQNQIINVSPAYSSIESSIGTGLVGAIGYDEFNYTVHIPSTLQEGSYALYIIATYRTSVTSQTGQSVSTPMESEIPIYLYVYGKPDIKATAVPTSQISPGEQVSLGINVMNTGTGPATNATLTIDNSSDFSIIGTPVFNIGSLGQSVPAQVTETMFAAQNITAGTHYIKGTIAYENSMGKMLSENISMPVSVVMNKPDIVLSLVGSNPPELYAGSNQSLEVLVQNIGTGTAKNISVNFFSGPSISVGSSVDSLYINSLPAGASATKQIYVGTYGQNIKNTSIGARISYKNANYVESYSSSQDLNIYMQASALYNITGIEASLSPGATYVPVTVKLENTGNEAADSVLLTMESVYPLSMVSSTYYVNSIAPNQTVNATFYVSVDSNGLPGDYPFTLYEQWKQPNSPQSQEFAGTTQYFVNVGRSSSTGYTGDAVAAIILIVVAVVAIRIMRKRNKNAVNKQEKAKRKA